MNGNGWSDIGYHFPIDRDGTVAKRRDVSCSGAHVRGRNANSIWVSLLGGHGGASDDSFAENFTDAQDKALRAMIAQLQSAHGGNLHLSGHNEYAAKACPCFDVRSLHG